MEKISEQGRLRPWMGIALFGAVLAFLIFVASPLQIKLGIPGLIITEIGLLIIAIVFCLIRKVKIREVFPVKKIKVSEFIGCILIVIGSFPVSVLLLCFTAMVLPSSVAEITPLTDFIYGNLNYPLAVLIVALMPAVCEEAINRGAILSNFRSLKHDWVIVLIMGLFFGLFHVTVLRFLPTMFIGMLFSFVLVKKNNILLAMLMHFTNNLISISMTYLSGQNEATMAAASNADYSAVFGIYLILGFLCPVIITLGVMLVDPKGHKKIRFLYAGILSAVMLISGIAFTAVKFSHSMILNTTFSYVVTEDDKECSMIDFDVEESRSATVAATLINAEGSYTIRIDGDSGSNIINAEFPEDAVRMVTYNVDLEPDHYTVTIIPGDDAINEHPEFQIMIR